MEPDCAATAVVELNKLDKATTSLQSSPRSDSQESQGCHTKNLKSCLKPLELSLACCGLIWKRNENARVDIHSGYAIGVSLAAWISALRLFAIYDHQDTYGPNLIKKIATQGWHIQIAIIISSFIYKYYMLQPRLVRRWEYYKRKYVGVPLHILMTFTYRATTIIDIAFGVILLIFIITFTVRTPEILLFQIEPFAYDSISPLGAFFYFLFDSFLVYIWLQPFLYLSIMAMLLRKEYLELTKHFRDAICGNPEAKGKGRRLDLEGYRLRHLALCKICEKLDDIMSPFILSTFIVDVPLIVSLVYILASMDTSLVEMFPSVAAAALCFVIAMIHLVGVTVIGATLTAAVSLVITFFTYQLTCVLHFILYHTQRGNLTD